jgi:hypothetical protein
MTEAQFKFLQHFYDFVIENFSNFEAKWKVELLEQFENSSLTEAQKAVLLDPARATTQFHAGLTQAFEKPEVRRPMMELASSLTEPVNKLATYVQIVQHKLADDEHAMKNNIIRQIAVVGRTTHHNLHTMLGSAISEETLRIFEEFNDFADQAEKFMKEAGIKEITSLQELEGMHYLSKLPEGFGTITPQP